MRYLRMNGKEYKLLRFRFMPEDYELETAEFSFDNELIPMSYKTYLKLWKGLLEVENGGKYEIVTKKRTKNWINLVEEV